MIEWRRQLLLHRIRDLSDAKMKAFSIGKLYYGAPERVRELIGTAINAFEADELDRCAYVCELAEVELLAARHHFEASHA